MPALPTSFSRTGASAARARTSPSLYATLNTSLSRHGGRACAGAAAAADPGHWQRGRLHHADRASRRQLRPCQAARLGQRYGAGPPQRSRASSASRRRSAPMFRNTRSRSIARRCRTLELTTDQVFQTLAGYLGSSYVSQFNKFGRVFQIYVQGDAQFRLVARGHRPPDGAQPERRHDPARTVLTITPSVGPSLISLYNLYPSASIIGVQASKFSSGDAIKLMEEVAADTLPPGTGFDWTALSFQEKLVSKPDLPGFRPGASARLSGARGPV